MEKLFNKFIAKISKYDLFVDFIPGILAHYFMLKILDINLTTENIIVDIVLFYFLGFCSSMFGSIFFSFEKIKNFFHFIEYKEYINLDCRNEKIKIIVQKISIIKAFIGSLIIFLLAFIMQFLPKRLICLLCVLIYIISLFIYLSIQINYMNARHKNAIKKKKV